MHDSRSREDLSDLLRSPLEAESDARTRHRGRIRPDRLDPPARGVAPRVVNRWLARFTEWLLDHGGLLDGAGREMAYGKLLNDPVDSFNCMLTAVSFCRNSAHVWLGQDPADGHIIGPWA